MPLIDPIRAAAQCERAYAAHKAGTCTFQAGAVHALLEGNSLAFGGTDDGETALVDLEFLPRLDGMLRVWWHSGIAQAAEAALTAILRPEITKQPLVLSGHSLGGGIAIYIGARLRLLGFPPVAIVTFGAPRVSTGLALAKFLAGTPLQMYRHGADIIPTLPPDFAGLMWQHPAPLIQFGTAGFPVEDHFLFSYQRALEQEPQPSC